MGVNDEMARQTAEQNTNSEVDRLRARVAELERELAETKAALAEWILSHESLDRKSNDALNDARAEVERLRRALRQCARTLKKWVRSERIASDYVAKFANELKEALAEVERLREESMRWQTKYTLRRQGYSEEIDRLRAEVERLKAQVERLSLLRHLSRPEPVADSVVDTEMTDAAPTKACGCPGGPVEHIMDCEAKRAEPAAEVRQVNQDCAPERVWCIATYDSFHDDHHWGQSGWWADCEQDGIGSLWQVQYIHPDVAEQELQTAVREALERAAERVASKVTRTHELGSVLVCGHGIPINNDDEMPKTERAIQRELRAAILGES